MCLGLVAEVPGAAPGVNVAEVQCLKRLYRESDLGCSCSSSFFLTGFRSRCRLRRADQMDAGFSQRPLDGSTGNRVSARVSVEFRETPMWTQTALHDELRVTEMWLVGDTPTRHCEDD
ncbi:hypothetical protein Pmani_023563 [Petrolisthes manimaculis]|uniref:Uncharacterized protein n=1 Tax=Petrolisthes manimaculis TaxID=1843537 RepID=A0AAE1TZH6_9EUCA|nr:hypothetical protein Pmani_023563 [Petrolisthes manimaculis]